MTSTSTTIKVFIDSSAIIALYNTSDSCHEIALKLYACLTAEALAIKLVTSTEVVSECLTIISQRVGKDLAKKFIKSLAQVEVVYMDEIGFARTLKEFVKIESKNVSFADCFSFVVCRRLRIKKVFAFDKHFKQQGFELLK